VIPPEFLAAVAAPTVQCDRLAGMCQCQLVGPQDDRGTRRVHFCGMSQTHASPDLRSPTHRCVCGEAWHEVTTWFTKVTS